MEQKQIDELEDSYTGEEFIDEDDLEQLQVEKKSANKSKKGSRSKVSPIKNTKTAAGKSAGDKYTAASKHTSSKRSEEKDYYEEIKVVPLKEETQKKENDFDSFKAKEETKSKSSSPVYDPWEDDDEPAGGGFFWKALTGILVILLVVSVFTQGFNFGGNTQVTGAATLSLSEAEDKALSYVNNNLLQPPFVAELEDSSDLGNLYQVTLSVAGQKVDSYITKDGKLFFPQGFDTSVDLSDKLAETDSADSLETGSETDLDTEAETETSADLPDETTETAATTETEETAANEETASTEEPEALPAGETKEFTLDAKKWLFNPNELTVNKGDIVKLTLSSPDLRFTFAVPDFGVEEEVSGTTLVEFAADKAGKFTFECSSCEDWRGMTGTLTVK